MNILRTIIHSSQLASVIDLPEYLRNSNVEVIILPTEEISTIDESPQTKTDLKKLKGCLKQYANPKLRALEDGAWERAVVEKYQEKVHEDFGR
jgi:hypothetical protein